MVKKCEIQKSLLAVGVALGLCLAGSSHAADPANLLTDGDFEDCTSSGTGFPESYFRVDTASTHDKWLDRANMWCEDTPDSGEGFYAEEQVAGSRDLLFQGTPLAGTCAVDGTKVTVCFDYINQDNDDYVSQSGPDAFRPVMGLIGFDTNGTWSPYAGGSNPKFPDSEPDGWEYRDGTQLFEIEPLFANTWQRNVCYDVPINDDYAALAFGWIGGYQGGVTGGDTNAQVALDNVSLFVSMFDAGIDVDPDTLNPDSKGKWITAYISLPECFDVYDVNDNVKINKLEFIGGDSTGTLGSADSIFADKCEVQDDGYGGYLLMCKFPRDEVIDTAEGLTNQTDMLKIRVRGTMYDGRPVAFSGLDTIRYLSDM